MTFQILGSDMAELPLLARRDNPTGVGLALAQVTPQPLPTHLDLHSEVQGNAAAEPVKEVRRDWVDERDPV